MTERKIITNALAEHLGEDPGEIPAGNHVRFHIGNRRYYDISLLEDGRLEVMASHPCAVEPRASNHIWLNLQEDF